MLANKAETPNSGKNKKVFKKFHKQFRDVTKDPFEFLSVQTGRAEKIKELVKDLYAWNIHEDGAKKDPEILNDIVLEGMDEEQIWQQIELRNNWIWPQLMENSSKLLSCKEKNFIVNINGNEPEKTAEDSVEDNMSEMSGGEDYFKDAEEMSDEDYNDEGPSYKESKQKIKKHKSIVDDKFFNLREMEEFLIAEDEKERVKSSGKKRWDDDNIDYFNEDLSDEDEENVNYKDFFADDPDDDEEEKEKYEFEHVKDEEDDEEELGEAGDMGEEEFEDVEDMYESGGKKLSANNEPSEDEESVDGESDREHSGNDLCEDDNKVKSSFEMRQERLKRRIEEFEEEKLSEKPWQLKGEIVASGRPQNSLLQEVLEFESTTRPAPVITEETSLRLEDIIKQRIKDKAWDDVERKVKPIQTAQQFRKTLTLDQEKSKESLAQIYEKQYQKELEKLDPNREENEEEPKQHKVIKELMKSLFNKLDALSNYHYTPKPVAPEPRIITNTPAVTMEEVAPVAVSHAKLLAPEEIKEHAKGDILGKSERTRTDKNRERRRKKVKQRAIHKAQDERILEKQKLGIKLTAKDEKNKVLKSVMKNKNVHKANKSTDGTSFKSSKAFFTQLQDKVTVKTGKERKKPAIDGTMSAKRLKL